MSDQNEYSPKAVTSVAEAVQPANGGRPVIFYDVPESLKPYAAGVLALGFTEMTPDEELMATKRARGEPTRMALEMAKQSLVAVQKAGPQPGSLRTVAVDLGSGSADVLWATMHPKVRGLAITAYNDVHNPNNAETTVFLSSRRVVVG